MTGDGLYALLENNVTVESKVSHMFVNQVLFRYKNFAKTFYMLECCSLYFNRKIAKSVLKMSNSGLQKPLKSSEFWIFSEMLTSSICFFVKF